MIVIGIDPHKQTHTAVALDAATGQMLGELTVQARRAGFERLVGWARSLDGERRFAIEDGRHVSGHLERHLIARGGRSVRVPPRMMGQARRADRVRGKSDPIDAEAVARAALARPDLPVATLAGIERDIGLLVGHRQSLVNERTERISRLRWLLHDIDPDLAPPLRTLDRFRTLDLVRVHTPALLQVPGCAGLTAAKIVAETAQVDRFPTEGHFARYAGTAPVPASSGASHRHRFNRRGNRQLNAAIHRIAVTQLRIHEPAQTYMAKKRAEGMSKTEALRALKRQLTRVVFRTMTSTSQSTGRLTAAAA